MFGLSFGEMLVLAVVALVVVGPRNLPTMMRTLGRTIGRLRRMALELRAESGIDKILEAEGIQEEIHNFRRLVSGELVDLDDDEADRKLLPPREREYPRTGADGDGVVPEDEVAYLEPPVTPPTGAPIAEPTQAAPAGQAPPPAEPASTSPPAPPGPAPRPAVPGAVPAPNPFARPVKNGTSPNS